MITDCRQLLIGISMYLLTSKVIANKTRHHNKIYLSLSVLAVGLIISLLAVSQFRRVDTTVDPLHIENASSLVSSGIYGFSRNPMYLSFAIILFALVVYLRSPLLLSGVAFFVVYITKYQIHPEEQFMRYKFGEQYENYARKVRRWL